MADDALELPIDQEVLLSGEELVRSSVRGADRQPAPVVAVAGHAGHGLVTDHPGEAKPLPVGIMTTEASGVEVLRAAGGLHEE